MSYSSWQPNGHNGEINEVSNFEVDRSQWHIFITFSSQPGLTCWELDPLEQTLAKLEILVFFKNMQLEIVASLFGPWYVNSLRPSAHICVNRLTITGSDNGLSPGWRQAIIWTNAGILSIGPLGTNFSENLIEILTFSFRKMRLKVSSAKWRPFCLGLNVLMMFCESFS